MRQENTYIHYSKPAEGNQPSETSKIILIIDNYYQFQYRQKDLPVDMRKHEKCVLKTHSESSQGIHIYIYTYNEWLQIITNAFPYVQ